MNQEKSMLQGNIQKVLIRLSLPIIASNFVQMAFGLIDMIWVGRLGADAISAVGTANFYMNLTNGFATLIILGTGVRVAQSLGENKQDLAKVYTKNGLWMGVLFSVLFTSLFFYFAPELIGYFKMDNDFVVGYANEYLRHAIFGVPFFFFSAYITTVLTSYGNTKITFKANAIGLMINIVLDPLMIFGLLGFPKWGIMGAAWATIFHE